MRNKKKKRLRQAKISQTGSDSQKGFASHVARAKNDRGNTKIIQLRRRVGKRTPGLRTMRRYDDVNSRTGANAGGICSVFCAQQLLNYLNNNQQPYIFLIN